MKLTVKRQENITEILLELINCFQTAHIKGYNSAKVKQ